MCIAIMGTGSLGGYYGGMLARAGHAVTCIARGAQLRALRERGLTVRSQESGAFTVPVAATDDPASVGPVDLVLFTVKAYDTDSAAALLPPLVGRGAAVLSLQNGIDNEDRLAHVVGPGAVLGGVVYRSARVEAPGVVTEGGLAGNLLFGELGGGISPRTEQLLLVFREAGLAAELHPDIRVALWEKFVVIGGPGTVSALTRLPYGAVRACAETLALCRGVMEEIAAVARAAGVALPADAVDRQLGVLGRVAPAVRSSLAHDLAAGRRLEIDAFNGAVVRLAGEHGVPAPLNFAVYASLKPYAEGAPAHP